MKTIVFIVSCGALLARAASPIAAGSGGLSYRSFDGSTELHLAGYAQSDVRAFGGVHPNPPDSFLFRRVRPELRGTLFRRFDFRVLPDFASGSLVLFDAFVDTHFPRFTIRAGKFRAPLGLEALQSAPDLMFIERGLPTGIGPNRDWGLQVSGELAKQRVSAALGVFQGASDSVLIDAGNNTGVDVGARVFATPWRIAQNNRLQRALGGLGFGIGVTAGEHRGPTLGFYRTFGQSTFFSYAQGAALAGVRVRYSPQAYYYARRFGLLTEYIRSTQMMARNGVETNVSNSAWQVAGSWVLTGEAKSYRGVDPRRPVFPRHGRGAVEVVARIGGMHLDRVMQERGLASSKTPSTAAREWVVGANWYLTRNVRAGFNYAHTSFASLPGVAPRPTEHAVLGRIQIAF